MCEKIYCSLATKTTKRKFLLVRNVLETLSFIWNWQEELPVLLFNFNKVNPTENCELNDANTKVEPKFETC